MTKRGIEQFLTRPHPKRGLPNGEWEELPHYNVIQVGCLLTLFMAFICSVILALVYFYG